MLQIINTRKSLIHSKRHLLCHTHIIFVQTSSHMTRQGVIEPLFTVVQPCMLYCRKTLYNIYCIEMNYFLQSTIYDVYIGKLRKNIFSSSCGDNLEYVIPLLNLFSYLLFLIIILYQVKHTLLYPRSFITSCLIHYRL